MTPSSPFDYAPAPESRAVVDIKATYGLFVGGEFVDGHGTPFATVDPSTEEVLAEVAEASDADVDAAVRAARRAYTRVWSRMPGSERAWAMAAAQSSSCMRTSTTCRGSPSLRPKPR